MYKNYYLTKLAELNLPDLKVNPKNKMTRLLKKLHWGVKLNGKDSITAELHKLSPEDVVEILGREKLLKDHIASCVDKTNYVMDSMPNIGVLVTKRDDMDIPHASPLFKYKGKYYSKNRTGYTEGYNSLDEIGTRWWRHPKPDDIVPNYLDVIALDTGTKLDSTDLRKVYKEILRKAKYKNRVHYKK